MSLILRYSFSSRIGKTIDVNGKPHVIKRQVYWEKALELNPDLTDYMSQPAWKYFYYEVEPLEETHKTETT